MQKPLSINNGAAVKIIIKAELKSSFVKIIKNKIIPKKVLPESPMNSFAGDQFKKRNTNKPTKKEELILKSFEQKLQSGAGFNDLVFNITKQVYKRHKNNYLLLEPIL